MLFQRYSQPGCTPHASFYNHYIGKMCPYRYSKQYKTLLRLICRATDEKSGIYFYVSSDGFWRIFAFVDGTFLVECFDNLYQTGIVGLLVATIQEDVDVSADNMFIWQATLDN